MSRSDGTDFFQRNHFNTLYLSDVVDFEQVLKKKLQKTFQQFITEIKWVENCVSGLLMTAVLTGVRCTKRQSLDENSLMFNPMQRWSLSSTA